MQVTRQFRRNARLQTTAFVVLFLAVIGLLAFLSQRYSFEADWTAGNRNTLTEASRTVLERATEPVRITAYASERERVRRPIRRLVERYERSDAAQVELEFVNPDARPQQARAAGIRRDGQLVISYGGETEKVPDTTEQAVTNAIHKLMAGGNARVYFLTGHGERDPEGRAGTGYGTLTEALEKKGLQVETLSIARQAGIPDDADALVLADPRQPLLDPEIEAIESYLADGGALLWLGETGKVPRPDALTQRLGVTFQPGVAVDPRTRAFGISDPTQVLAGTYPDHAITQNFDTVSMFPGASGIAPTDGQGLKSQPLARTAPASWLETGPIEGTIRFDEGSAESKGPVTVAMAFTKDGGSGSSRPSPMAGKRGGRGNQGTEDGPRAVVTGDADFLSNRFIGEGGNRQLGVNIVRWLALADAFVSIPDQSAPGTRLSLTPGHSMAMTTVFLGVLPLALLAAGVGIWLRRRKL